MTTQNTDYGSMSDEELLQAPPPVVVEQEQSEADKQLAAQQEQDAAAEASAAAEKEQADAAATEAANKEAAEAAAALEVEKQATSATNVDEEAEGGNNATKETKTVETPANADDKQADEAAQAAAKQEQTQEAKPAAQVVVAPTAEETLKKIMAPFKANGKEITLKDPEEAIRLMQMGANFTRKMQEMAPHRKVLLMLENNGLLDENKLNFLIDLDKKNPEAIKKLLKDSGTDPMSIDTTVEPAYTEGNHKVGDSEVLFQHTLENVLAQPMGQEMINEIHGNWDQASKLEIGKDPSLMETFRQQRENGIYDQITTEMERQKTLGKIPAGTPFILAYNQVGNYLVQQRTANGAPAQTAPAAAVPVATRVAVPKPTITNGEKANAASGNRSTPKNATAPVNYLAMSDEDFLKAEKIINR